MCREKGAKTLLECRCDLGALRSNARYIKQKAGSPLIAVLKSDGYGAGLVRCARALEGEALALAVADANEAEALLRAGIGSDILTLAPPARAELEAAKRGVIPALDRPELVSELARRAPSARVQLRLDLDGSGIGLTERGYLAALSELAKHPSVTLWGVFAHCPSLYRGENADDIARRFSSLCEAARSLAPLCVRNLATSAALSNERLRFDAVRCGTALMGLPSFPHQKTAPLRPVLSLRAPILRIFNIKGGLSLYDCAADGSQITRAGLVSAGYGELPALLQRDGVRAAVWVELCPVIGRAAMCHTLIDLTRAPDAREGDEAVFVGESGSLAITAESFALSCGVPACRCEGALMCTPSADKVYFE